MATCENCNTTFTPSAEPTEVTSTRVLCPSCEAARRAERLKRAQANSQVAGIARAKTTAVGTSPPASTVRRAVDPEVRNAPPRDAQPRDAQPVDRVVKPEMNATPPARARVPEATPRAPDAPARATEPSKARATPPEPARMQSKTLNAKPAAKAPAAKPASTAKKAMSPDVRREVELLKRRENKVMLYGWIVCGVLLLVAGGFWLTVQAKKTREAEAFAAHQKEVDDFVKQMKGFDLMNEAQAKQAIELGESKTSLWKGEEISGDVTTVINRARTNLDSAADRRGLLDRLASIEEGVKHAADKKPEELAQMRRSLEDLDLKGDAIGTEFKTRVAQARSTVERTYAVRLHEEAKAMADAGPGQARVALSTYTRAEDELVKLFERALKSKNKDAEDFFKGHFVAVIQESDALAASVFTPEVIEKTPWTDLLAGDNVKNWQSDGLKGFRIENGVLHAVGLDAGSAKTGIMSIGDREQWRDFQLDLDFVVVKGSAVFFFRLGRRADGTVEQFGVTTVGEDGLKAGKAYKATITFIGSKLNVTFEDESLTGYETEVKWTQSRKGAFGVTIPEESELKFTRVAIRALR